MKMEVRVKLETVGVVEIEAVDLPATGALALAVLAVALNWFCDFCYLLDFGIGERLRFVGLIFRSLKMRLLL